MKMILLAMVLTIVCATFAEAGPIGSACLRSGNANASPSLCGCIQQAADLTLGSTDQQRAAKFFENPDRAQEVRMSKTDNDNAFWQRYANFGTTAESLCQ